MKKALRILALVLIGAAVGLWAMKGANRGWTKNRIQVVAIDPVTGLDDVKWKETFIPGVDFLAGTLVAAGVLAGASFLFRNKKTGV